MIYKKEEKVSKDSFKNKNVQKTFIKNFKPMQNEKQML